MSAGHHTSSSSSRPPYFPLPPQWTPEENKLFEVALVRFPDGMPDRWHAIASQLPGKSPQDVLDHYRRLLVDVAAIEAGKVELPDYMDEDDDDVDEEGEANNDSSSDKVVSETSKKPGGRAKSKTSKSEERKRGDFYEALKSMEEGIGEQLLDVK
ncbi:hypothetical protein J5N97_004191 [Dioscorea zingiberensis]|uniref:Myb-like domain-containing protein n=1 Tax=Dioscorea zingiberensis TaxID=325984 RepID=A0A9D5D5L9_9LILI|nr:hypothetical protein J5N97_004191 [Dioscorea zingiberensis]